MSRRLLVTGASGQLGRRVARLAVTEGWQVAGTYRTATPPELPIAAYPLDVTDQVAVTQLIATVKPHAIVHTAALVTGADLWTVNADGAAHVAMAAVRHGVRLVHISSDAIFDGRRPPYRETESPAPLAPYGASKAAAETAVRAVAPDAVLVRTSLILDDDPLDKHSRMVLDIAAGRRPEALFTDEIRCPVPATDLAAAILELIDLPYAGPINVAGPDALSRYDLGVLIALRYGVDPSTLPSATLAGSGLQRAADVRLDCTLARTYLRTRLRGAREFLQHERDD